MGPAILFDKSFLQALSLDEAAILDQMYRCVICPIFWVETLADLSKMSAKREPEDVVVGLAERTPVCHSALTASHWEISFDELFGGHVPMDGRPMIAGGRPVHVEGKDGVVFRKSPEQEAFERWQRRRFDEVERVFARHWRDQLDRLDLTVLSNVMKEALRKEDRPRSMQQAREMARQIVSATGSNYRQLRLALALAEVPADAAKLIVQRWKTKGAMPLQAYAPYTAFCLEVDLFFQLCLSNGIVSDQRPSNLVDLSYLYYLPFTQGFVSGDKLHRSMVPLFLRDNQFFCWGPDLKADLRRLDEHFWALPEDQRTEGLFKLASTPPADDNGLIASHWDKIMSRWRERKPLPTPPRNAEMTKRIIAEANTFIDAAKTRKPVQRGMADPDVMVIERHIPHTRGKWRMFSPEVEEANRNERKANQREAGGEPE